MLDWWKGFESVSSSSQANEVKELRKDSVRRNSKGLLEEVILDSGFLILDWESDCSRQGRKGRVRLKTKYFWFMDKIVTGGVGHLEG